MATLAVTNSFSAGTTIVAADMNTNFDDIEAFVHTTPGVIQNSLVDAKGDLMLWDASDKALEFTDSKITMGDNLIETPELIDYGETVNAIGATGGGTQSLNIALGNVQTATVDTSTNTFTFDNPSPDTKSCSFTLILTNGGSQTVVWPTTVQWAGGTAPTLTTSGRDVLTFMTIDAGAATWYGFAAGLDMSVPS